MAVLSVGILPRSDNKHLQEMLALQKTADGFFLEAHSKLMPVDSATRGVFFAGCAEGPKDIKEAVTQASAAARALDPADVARQAEDRGAHRAGRPGALHRLRDLREGLPLQGDPRRREDQDQGDGHRGGVRRLRHLLGRVPVRRHRHEPLHRRARSPAQIDAILEENPAEKIVTFACNWCSYAGADFAGVSRLQYPPNARLIRTMCSGRVDESFIWRAFRLGAPVVLVSGCHFGDCHYIDANHWTKKRVEKVWKRMEKLGIRPERLQLEWVSAAEGLRWQAVMKNMEELRQGGDSRGDRRDGRAPRAAVQGQGPATAEGGGTDRESAAIPTPE